jgi:hypothetical protein
MEGINRDLATARARGQRLGPVPAGQTTHTMSSNGATSRTLTADADVLKPIRQ